MARELHLLYTGYPLSFLSFPTVSHLFMTTFDPQAKLARNKASRIASKLRARERRAQAKAAYLAQNPLKHGSLSPAENAVVGEVVSAQDAADLEVTREQVHGMAVALRRSPSAITVAITRAREKLHASAEFYVDAHRQAVQGALRAEMYDVARKGATEMIEKLSTTDETGKTVRIVEKPDSGSTMPSVMIGIALWGLPHRISQQ